MAVIQFNVRALESLNPPVSRTQVDYWDRMLPNFGLRVSKSGRKSWTVMYRHHNRLRRMTLGIFGPAGLSLAEARRQAFEILSQAANGLDPALAKLNRRRAETYSELADLYIEWAKGNKSSWPEDFRILNRDILPFWKNLKAVEINKKDVRSLIDRIVNRGARVHANRTFALVRRIFNFGMEHDLLLLNPCQSMRRPCAEAQRQRVLSADEIGRLWRSMGDIDPIFAAAIKVGLLTAQRPGEIRSMTWEQVDMRDSVWTIPVENAKNRLSHRVPLAPEVLRILEDLRTLRSSGRWIFPSERIRDARIYNVQPAIVLLRKKLGAHFTAHDLRRTAASNMTAMGVPRLVVSKILNHSEPGVTRIYDRHGYDREKRDALCGWAERILWITGES